MSAYYFIENKNPQGDPNIDLNFDNDLLYSDIIADDYDKYRESRPISENMPLTLPRVPVKKQHMDTKTKHKEPNYNIYIMFFVIVILSIFLWYTYGSHKYLSHDNLSFTSTPNLVMLSPDFGNGSRFGSL